MKLALNPFEILTKGLGFNLLNVIYPDVISYFEKFLLSG